MSECENRVIFPSQVFTPKSDFTKPGAPTCNQGYPRIFHWHRNWTTCVCLATNELSEPFRGGGTPFVVSPRLGQVLSSNLQNFLKSVILIHHYYILILPAVYALVNVTKVAKAQRCNLR
jgi:hypothetical protein